MAINWELTDIILSFPKIVSIILKKCLIVFIIEARSMHYQLLYEYFTNYHFTWIIQKPLDAINNRLTKRWHPFQ